MLIGSGPVLKPLLLMKIEEGHPRLTHAPSPAVSVF